jgi:hypothetical protein
MKKNKMKKELDKLRIILSSIHSCNLSNYGNKENFIDQKIDDAIDLIRDLQNELEED